MSKQQGGFTLIELITVIVILGILSAFALPRFAGIESEARTASLNGLAGSMRSAAALSHSVQLATGAAPGDTISMEGQAVTQVNGYPTADDAGIEAALQDVTGYDNPSGGVYQIGSATTPASCQATYTAAPVGGAPAVAVVSTGC